MGFSRQKSPSAAGVEFDSAAKRDAAVEASYRCSDVMVALNDGPIRNVWSFVVQHALELATLITEEHGAADALAAVDEFSLKHFGRSLEPALRGTLAFHVARPSSHPARPFSSWPEAKRWEAAAREVLGSKGWSPTEEGATLRTLEAIARRAGWTEPVRVRRMPPMGPNVEREANRQRAQAQSAEQSERDERSAFNRHTQACDEVSYAKR